MQGFQSCVPVLSMTSVRASCRNKHPELSKYKVQVKRALLRNFSMRGMRKAFVKGLLKEAQLLSLQVIYNPNPPTTTPNYLCHISFWWQEIWSVSSLPIYKLGRKYSLSFWRKVMNRAEILWGTEWRYSTSNSLFNLSYTVFHKSAFCTRSSSFEQQQSLTWDVKTEEEQIKSPLQHIFERKFDISSSFAAEGRGRSSMLHSFTFYVAVPQQSRQTFCF